MVFVLYYKIVFKLCCLFRLSAVTANEKFLHQKGKLS